MGETRLASWGVRRLAQDDGGQISFLAVLGAAAFASLLLLVVNTGWATSEKIHLQNTADAVAISGATWVARGLNVISLDNVTQTQLLAMIMLVPAVDAMITATLVEIAEQARWAAGACGPYNAYACAYAAYLGAQATHLTSVLRPLLEGLRVVVRNVLWPAMELLAGVSDLVVGDVLVRTPFDDRSYPYYGERAAQTVAERSGARLGVLAPYPELPVRRAELSYLCDPTRYGSKARDHRGYHALLGYRDLWKGPLEVYGEAVMDRAFDVFRIEVGPFSFGGFSNTQARFWFKKARELSPCPPGSPINPPPYPYLLKDGAHRDLEFLGFAYTQRGVAWAPRLFKSPFGEDRLTYAQVRVFNPISFDLFTQDWRVKLTPATMIEDGRVGLALADPGVQLHIGRSGLRSAFVRSVAPVVSASALHGVASNH